MKENSIIYKPWIRNQIENHLIIQYFVTHIPASYVATILLIFYWSYEFFTNGFSSLSDWGNIVFLITSIFIIFETSKKDKYFQAFIAWVAIKGTLLIVCFLVMTVGTHSSIKYGESDALETFFLGFIWFPLIEFFPIIDKKQKLITLFRIILTVCIVTIGIYRNIW